MPRDLKDILTNLNKDIEQDKLLEYINRNLSAEDQHALEMQMNDDPFMSDAVEGLQQFEKSQGLPHVLHQLNEDMRRQLLKKKRRREQRTLPSQTITYILIILLLILIIVGYVVIRKFNA